MSSAIIVARWFGRISGIFLAVFMVLITVMATGHGKTTTPMDIAGFSFIICFIIGLLLLWPKEKLGIILSLAGVTGFLVIMAISDAKEIYRMLYLPIPPAILLVCRILEKKKRPAKM